MNARKILYGIIFIIPLLQSCNTISYTNMGSISVPEEGAINLVKITDDEDMVKKPYIKYDLFNIINSKSVHLEWWINPMIAISPNGERIAYINDKNDMSNVMVKNTSEKGPSTQRTFRNAVMDLSWSPDGKTICFTE